MSNLATGNMLEGVRGEIPSLGLRALTNGIGQYVINSVPAGTHEVVASSWTLITEHNSQGRFV